MAGIGEAEYDDLEAFWHKVKPTIAALGSLQAVAQRFAEALYSEFAPSLALARVFATLELRALPSSEREWAQRFAASHLPTALDESTLILSLLGTQGEEAAWCDRSQSKGHLAIPLLSEGFVGEIPMIARLLKEIGYSPAWDSPSTPFVTRAFANVNGVFHVGDARNATDERGRQIIPASDFVERHGIRTVFGLGGTYLSRPMFITIILFCREELLRAQAMKFVPLIGSLKAATTRLINRGALFTPAR